MSRDALLLVGEADPKLPKLLNKLGYTVLGGPDGSHVAKALTENVVDLIVIDGRLDIDALELCRYFKSDAASREVPIVILAKDRLDALHIKEQAWADVECLTQPASIGVLAGKIATQLRLRKMTGEDNPHASLAQMNAALRDNNEIFKREREQARAIQQSLLPPALPKHDSYDMAITYRPLDEVGGDWYFVQNLPGGKFAFQVLDVTGHGLSAALIGSMTRLAIGAVHREEPGELMGEVNRLLTPHLPEGRFITMVSSVYDPSGKLQFSRAGHPPALLLKRRESKVHELKPPGYAVGFLEESQFPSCEATLEPQDAVVFFTDGITEAENRFKRYFGMDGLSKALLETPSDSSAQQLMESIMAKFEAFMDGRRLKDDVTLFALVRRK